MLTPKDNQYPTVLGDIGVDSLNGVVVLQQLQHVAVGLPEELHPGRQDDAVRAFLRALAAHGAQQQAGGRASGENKC